jgi:hypothetical protein
MGLSEELSLTCAGAQNRGESETLADFAAIEDLTFESKCHSRLHILKRERRIGIRVVQTQSPSCQQGTQPVSAM